MIRSGPRALSAVQRAVFRWFAVHQRDLPWRNTKDPYRILVSEIMLQQTQVDRVIPKYRAFLRTFPALEILARATPREVLLAWAGLGYNRRALYLHRLAREVMARFGGRVPTDVDSLRTLPGVGPYTAAAVATFSTGVPHAMAETNVSRVLSRVFLGKTRQRAPTHAGQRPARGPGAASSVPRTGKSRLHAAGSRLYAQKRQHLIQQVMPTQKVAGFEPSLWGHALMDLGALVCKAKPRCAVCPLQKMCKAYPKFEGSGLRGQGREIRRLHPSPSALNPRAVPDRLYRGRIVAALREVDPRPLSLRALHGRAETPSVNLLGRLVQGLVQEGMLEHARNSHLRLARRSRPYAWRASLSSV